ncbi:MAG: hypothetical protein ABW039_12450 [Sphingobium sp.]
MTKGKANGATGAGAIIAFLILVGTIVGGIMGQPSIGLLVGAGTGILIATLLFLNDRRRQG